MNEKDRNQSARLKNQKLTLFGCSPKKCAACHYVICDALPIKQHPYRLSLLKFQDLRREVQYMLNNDVIEPRKIK